MKIIDKKQNSISVFEMGDGEIVQWGASLKYNGRVVQKFNDSLVSLGMPSGNSWSPVPESYDCRVIILTEGTKLEI